MTDIDASNPGSANVLSQMPPEILEVLDAEARAGMSADAAVGKNADPASTDVNAKTGWRHHPINIRLSIPTFQGRVFLTVVGGTEKRSTQRIESEKQVHPLKTAGNFLFLVGIAGTFYMVAVLVIFMFHSVIEF